MQPRFRSWLLFSALCLIPSVEGCGLFAHKYSLELGVSEFGQVRSLFVIVGDEAKLDPNPDTVMALVNPDKQASYVYFAQLLPESDRSRWQSDTNWEMAGLAPDLVSVDTASDGTVSVKVGHKLLESYPDAALLLIADCDGASKPATLLVPKVALHTGSDGNFRVWGSKGQIQPVK